MSEMLKSLRKRVELRIAYDCFIQDFQPTQTVTFNFGPWVSCPVAHYRMKGYACRIERIANGRNWHRLYEPRLAIVGFPEHLDKNPHWHCVVRAPGRLSAAIDVCSAQIWDQLVPAGQIHVADPRTLEKIASYFTKELTIPGRTDEVFVYAKDI